MSAFEETIWKIRISLIDEKGEVVDSFDTPGMNWLKLRPEFERQKKAYSRKSSRRQTSPTRKTD